MPERYRKNYIHLDMKKLSVITFGIVAIALSSCSKKDYNCICYGGLTGGKVTLTISSSSKSKAENKCTALNNPPGTADGYSGCHVE